VRGNGKIIQELEAAFRGAGWNVIKVIWGGDWDELFARDHTGLLLRRMEECVDGDYQTFKAKDGAYLRKEFFGSARGGGHGSKSRPSRRGKPRWQPRVTKRWSGAAPVPDCAILMFRLSWSMFAIVR
jgi:hypothetical protein